MASKKRNKKTNRRISIYLMVMIVLIIGIILTVPNYLIQGFEKYQEKQQLKSKIETLKKEEKILSREVAQLNDAEYIARIARQKYLFSKDGEMIIKVDKKEISKQESKSSEPFNFKIDSRIISGLIIVLILLLMLKTKKKRKSKTPRK